MKYFFLIGLFIFSTVCFSQTTFITNKLIVKDSIKFRNSMLDSFFTASKLRSNHTGTQAISTVTGLQNALDAKLPISDTANIRFRPQAGSNITLSGTYPNITIASSGNSYSAQPPITLTSTTFGADTTILGTKGYSLNLANGKLNYSDSTIYSTKASATKQRDSVVALIPIVTGFVSKSDSTLYSTKANATKQRDSVVALLSSKLNTSDTLSMLDGKLSSIVLNNTGIIHTTPSTFTRSGGVWTATQSLASQSAFTALARASGSGSPSFQSLDTFFIPNFYLKARSRISAGYGLTYNSTTGVVSKDTSSYKITFNSPVKAVNDSTVGIDTAVTNRAYATTWGGLQYRLDSLKGASWFSGASSQWTTITNDIYYNTGRVLIGGTSSPASTLEVRTPNLGTIGTTYSPTNGISVINNIDATVSQNQEVTVLQSEGRGWKTNSIAGSQYSGWKLRQAITSGAANPSSTWNFDYSINRASSTTPFSFGNTGAFTASGTGSFGGLITASAGINSLGGVTVTTGSIAYTENASTTSPPGIIGLSLRPTSAASGAGNTQYSSLLQMSTNVASNTTNYFGQWGVQAQGTYAASGVPVNNLVFMNRTTTTASGSYTSLMNIQNDGNVGIGVSTPTGVLHLKAGTATASTAPLKFTSGTLLTTQEAFTQEADANSFYQTNNALNRYSLGGSIKDFITTVDNTSTTETDLYTYTTKASTLAADGGKLMFKVAGTFNDATSTAQLQFYFGGMSIGNTGTLTVSSVGGWNAEGMLIRTSSTTVRAIVTVNTPGASTALYTTQTDLTGLTLSATNIIKLTGTAGGATGGSGDISAKLGTITWMGAANN